MHVIFSVPMLGIRQHYGMSVGEFTTKHLRLGNYIFDIGGKSRRFIPQAMCLLEEYSDEEWIKMEKAQADEEAAKKKAAEEKKAVDDAAKAKSAANAAWRAKPRVVRLFTKKPHPELG